MQISICKYHTPYMQRTLVSATLNIHGDERTLQENIKGCRH